MCVFVCMCNVKWVKGPFYLLLISNVSPKPVIKQNAFSHFNSNDRENLLALNKFTAKDGI